MTTKPLKKGATYDDMVRVPEQFVAEMFDGELYASPRPAQPHARAAVVLVGKLGDSFDFGDGPGGWLLLVEPELHFGNDVLVPDLAGWRRERLSSTQRAVLDRSASCGGATRGVVKASEAVYALSTTCWPPTNRFGCSRSTIRARPGTSQRRNASY